ncbi:inositol monophosphatase family protein [Salsipaludibacter albus]|uniref:inositol monophosphatase family protein n=1 Tax=Salsipaludibacter albus TaxID=2849650 RepID=UPI001EE48EF2|nr:inositol monophosphatase [Salsipaludibacter albus]MBY5162796.1 inositol monophosphatase [Salsipaludibacter albus]
MDPSPSPRVGSPAELLDPAVARVVRRAAGVANRAVDDLRSDLLAGAGTSRRHVKRDGSPVTDADRAVDRALVTAFTDAFPDHGVLSEEGDTTWHGAEWTWVVDPIDGTSNYAAGLPWWCVSVGLAHHGEVVWGMVDAPELGRRWEATRGGATTRDGRLVHVAEPVDVSRRVAANHPVAVTQGTIRRRRRGTFYKARVMGSAALELAMVADGTLLAAYQRVPKAWDVAAGGLLVTEAGGAVVCPDQPSHFPLQPGVDVAGQGVVTAAGPDRAWVQDFVERLWPDDES